MAALPTPKEAGIKAQNNQREVLRLIELAVGQAKALHTELTFGTTRVLAGPPRGTKKYAANLAGTVRSLRAAMTAWGAAAKLAGGGK